MKSFAFIESLWIFRHGLCSRIRNISYRRQSNLLEHFLRMWNILMLLFLMDADLSCDWILIQIFYAHRFVGKDADACNQHSWHHTSHIQICKQLIVRWSTRAWFLYVWDLLQLFERWRLGISRCLPRPLNCLRTESADFCSLNGRTIRTDWRSGVDLHGGAGVCLDVTKLEIIDWIRCLGYANCRNIKRKGVCSQWAVP